MYFKGEGHWPIPTKDVISWIFDEVSYDQDQPVCISFLNPADPIADGVKVYIDVSNPSNYI